ncbi:MAG: MMPL family transporter [Planctomycetaceae bacterium]
MLFKSLGDLTARHAWLILAAWVAVVVASISAAPSWDSVVENGEFAFLPQDSPSRVANAAFRDAFPGDQMRSTLVLVARRESGGEGLLDDDFAWLSEHVIPELHRMSGVPRERDDETASGDASTDANAAASTTENATGGEAVSETAKQAAPDAPARKNATRQLVQEIMSFEDRKVGDLLISEDRQATSIVLSMTTEFLDQANRPLVDSVEKFIRDLSRIPSGQPDSLPAGLEISISGSATFGRDMMLESAKSAKSTEHWTVILVVVLLIGIYRAPMLAFIPLATVAVATAVSRSLLAVAAQHGIINLFNGIETYVTVLVYGAGVDYCLFLIARYREELDGGQTIEEAISGTMERIGAALTASACTVMCGIGMMYFAEFGKFSQAGIAITFGLAICLVASLTLTPAILRISGRWAFWPARIAQSRDTFPTGNSLFVRLQKTQLLKAGWSTMGRMLEQRPWTAFLSSILLLLPFSIAGFVWFGNLSYGLLSELPETSASVYGAAAAAKHFPPGEVSPITIMIEAEDLDFSLVRGQSFNAVRDLTDRLLRQKDQLGLHSVRSLSRPKGRAEPSTTSIAVRSAQKRHARDYFVSPGNRSITRISLIPKNDPFARSSIAEFRTLRSELPNLLPDSLRKARIWFVGNTAEISDLKDVTDRDQIRIDALVMMGVYLILVALLKKPGICAYLMFTVLYSYFATLGFTFLWFRGMNPESFTGLDWKVPMFLFTILIAVGEDYNIFLMARITEEQKIHGPLKGITVALERTGGIISSCGIIMAGTFCSLLAGSLVGMDQLGLALATGVVLDTFVIRPIMVPSFMILLTTRRLGPISRLAGYGQTETVARAA